MPSFRYALYHSKEVDLQRMILRARRHELGRGGSLPVQIVRGAEKDFLLIFQESDSSVARSTQQSSNPPGFMVVVNYQRWRSSTYCTGIVLVCKELCLQLGGKSIFFLLVIAWHILFLKGSVTCFTPTRSSVQCRRASTKGVQRLGLVTLGTPLFSWKNVRISPPLQKSSCCARLRAKRRSAPLEVTFNFSLGLMDRNTTPGTRDLGRLGDSCFFLPYFGTIPIRRSTARTSKDFDLARSPHVPTAQALNFFYCSFHPFLYSIAQDVAQQQERRAAIFQAGSDARLAA